ncbi:MAG TPA: primosomal protein N' [Thermoanaerobaculia bacterium]|nr:primosomal protein N' [Thermoanaerobaculia bacterium]
MTSPLYAEVALPLPLPGPLTYEVPDAFAPLARPGVRARVQVGRRRLVGVVVAVHAERPAGIELRPLEEVVDLEPVLGPELLELAGFVAGYYMAPLGEVFRAMLPPDLPPWGDRRVWLTDAGALAPPRSAAEAAVVEALRGGGRTSAAELQAQLGIAGLGEVLEGLADSGRIGREERERRGARYVTAVELPPGDREAQLAACGRSPAGRAAVEYLAAIGRPATIAEVSAAAGASPAVVKRLAQRGVLRQFTQVEKLALDHHMLDGRAEAPFRLRPDQEEALTVLERALSSRRYAPFLLHGMTGSGKTEVYLRAVEAALGAGRTALLLVPEIALVPALARAVEQRFGERLAILHSGLGGPERQQEWERVRRGEARVVLGPRSALFAPLADLGLLVVDEEQDPAYKQESVPRYQGRDVALVRGKAAKAVTLLVSATPSLESRHNAERGKLGLLRLTERVGEGGVPEGVLVDLRGLVPRRPGEIYFSERLREEIAAALAGEGQIILLRNRRGYSPLLLCRACGEDLRCDQCGLPRTFHRRAGRLLCHYCGSTLAVPARCPTCGEAALEPIGAGTERVEETFAELFPGVPLDVLDRDTARRPGGPAAILERFARGEVRVLVGTQMVSKGHHFPAVALTAVLAADTYLGFPDFRAVERTYNLLVQLAGRAGRGDRPGKVVIQTFHPEHYAIQAALLGDDAAFAREELRFRRVFHYPPFSRMVQLLVEDRNRAKAEARIGELAARLGAHPLARSVRVTGPAPAPLERLRGLWRFQLLLRTAAVRDLHRLLAAALPPPPHKGLVVDVDPQQLL